MEKEELLVTSNFSFSHSVFKRLVLQTSKNKGLFGKGLSKELKYKENLERPGIVFIKIKLIYYPLCVKKVIKVFRDSTCYFF